MRALAAALVLAFGSIHAAFVQGPVPSARQDLARIYSADPADSWNRIFASLFTRTIAAQKTDEFADAAPFLPAPDLLASSLRHRVSRNIIDLHENGDRAIEALYPSFMTDRGTLYVLEASHRAELLTALTDALADRTRRTPVERALMQADLWSAFDALDRIAHQPHVRHPQQGAAAEVIAPLAKLIAKLALTDSEIAALPDNYETARRAAALPDLFARESEWMEVVYAPHREHDAAAGMRRASRVFVKPSRSGTNERFFLDSLANSAATNVGMTALAIQTLVIDAAGHAIPTHLISDVQIRTLRRDRVVGVPPIAEEYELSREKLRTDPSSGGFVHFTSASPAFFPAAGNDYGFATPAFDRAGGRPPIVSTLGTRCSLCHGSDGSAFMTFNLIFGPGVALPPLVRLRQPNDDRARYVAAAKEARDDFKRLIALSGLLP
ncbi:MAG TPA: hypothetical protein VL225_14255 [Vicinamibacterales bacterium]|nr:hypothetical protein [Vicinamibacterales bacterium]